MTIRERLVASTGEHPAAFGAAEVAELVCLLDRMGEALGYMHYCAAQWHPRTNDDCAVDEWLDEAAATLEVYQRTMREELGR